MSKNTDVFPFRRGSNMGLWLSQANVLDEQHLASFYQREHIARLARAGADHLRLPVDYELIEEPEAPHRLREQGMRWLEQALEWAWAEGLGVTLDLHKCAGMSFFTPESNRLWNDAGLQRRFAGLWRQLAERFRTAPHDRLAFELLNEPTAPDNALWNDVAAQALAAIREVHPQRWVVIGSNSWNVPPTFADLRDFRDPRVAYAVHWYEPFIFTHQKAPWCEWLKTIDLTVEYPGVLPDLAPRQAELRDPAWREQLMLFSGQALGYERMERWFAPVADFARRTGAPIYCTEFGCWDPAPRESQLHWFRDSLKLFAAHDVAWAQWEYGSLFERDGRPKPPLAVLFPDANTSQSLIRVAAIAIATLDGLPDDNYRRAVRLVEIALESQPDIVLLPEAFAVGYCGAALPTLAERRDSRHLRRFRALSRTGNCLIVLGFLERDDAGIRNAVILFDQGEEIGVHYKRTLWPDAVRPYRDETALMIPGPGVDVFATRFGRCAVITCYENMVDGDWAEAAPCADFILSPYNCEDDPSRHNIAKSRQYGVPSAWANRTGTVWAGNGYCPNPGTAGIVDDGGRVVARSEPGVEAIVVGALRIGTRNTR